jgi:hypothetical protein
MLKVVIIIVTVLHLLLWLLLDRNVRRAGVECLARIRAPFLLLVGLCLLAAYPCARHVAPISRFGVFLSRSVASAMVVTLAESNLDDWTTIEASKSDIYATLGALRQRATPEDLVLTFRQSDIAFYGNCRWICDFDTRLTDVYKAQSPEEAYHRLKKKGIRYIFLPYYSPPTLCNTPLEGLVGDPAYCTLLANHGEYRLLQLNDTIDHDTNERSKFVLQDDVLLDWTAHPRSDTSKRLSSFSRREEVDGASRLIIDNSTRKPAYLFSGSGDYRKAPRGGEYLKAGNNSHAGQTTTPLATVIFASHATPSAASDQVLHLGANMWMRAPAIKRLTVHRIQARVEGRGHFKIWFYEYAFKINRRGVANRKLVYDGLLTEKPKTVSGQILSADQGASFRIVFELPGRANLQVHEVSMTEVSPPTDSAGGTLTSQASQQNR